MTEETNEYWEYIPKFIPEYVYEPLYEFMKEYCIPIGKPLVSGRVSCIFVDIRNKLEPNADIGSFYQNLKSYWWKDAPDIIHEICKLVEQKTHDEYDYVLVHIYPDGNANIAMHSDSEALGSTIASVSFGAQRKFRMRKIGRTQGWDHEIHLGNGDLFVMKGPDLETGRVSCQKVYQHGIPVEKKVKISRINMTFRQFQ